MTSEQQHAMRMARSMLDLNVDLDQVLSSGLIPASLHEFVREQINRERAVILVPATTLAADPSHENWLIDRDRGGWYYWPSLRNYLLVKKGWDSTTVRSLDDSSDRVLSRLADPNHSEFDKRGLVIGFCAKRKNRELHRRHCQGRRCRIPLCRRLFGYGQLTSKTNEHQVEAGVGGIHYIIT